MTKERPILFSTPMVKAILEGRKTMTRRVVKSRHESGMFAVSRTAGQITSIESLDWDERNCEKDVYCPYGNPGDILWVREKTFKDVDDVYYYADGTCCDQIPECCCCEVGKPRLIPSIHMPKSACRIWLEITDVRVERLHEITNEDCKKEGVTPDYSDLFPYAKSFKALWRKINGEESWERNPFVWVICFKVLSTTGKPNIEPTVQVSDTTKAD
jgi:hypothetical protein